MPINSEKYDENAIMQKLDKYPLQLLLDAVLAKFGAVGSQDAQLVAKLAVLKSLISLNDRILIFDASCKNSDFPRETMINAVHSMLSAPDFYEVEYTNYGPPTRWTGPSRNFSFDIFIDRSIALAFKMDFEAVYFDRPASEMHCFVDGQAIELSIESGGGGYLALGDIPARDTQGASVITFVCPNVKSPRENGLPDDRLLGVRFRSLSINERKSETVAIARPGDAEPVEGRNEAGPSAE